MRLIQRFANILIGIGAIAISISVTIAATPFAFLSLLIGHIIWFVTAIKQHNKSLVELNGFLIILDIWAVYIRI